MSTYFPMVTERLVSRLFDEATRLSNNFRDEFHYPMNTAVYAENDDEINGVIIEIALAGFTKKEIFVSIEEKNKIHISVKQNKENEIDTETSINYITRNISRKDSDIVLTAISDIDEKNVKVVFENGLLTIKAPFARRESKSNFIEIQ